MSENSKRIFHNQQHKMTAPFNEWRDNHSRQHKGTDFGTYHAAALQYPPLDNAYVFRVITEEAIGNLRGKLVDLHWPEFDLGLILQHGANVLVCKGQFVDKTTPVLATGMTGKYDNGDRVSTGVHCHAELYYISTGERIDFETFDFEEVEMTETKIRQIVQEEIAKALSGAGKDVDAWAKKTWDEAKADNITDGSRPQGYAKRQEVVALIKNALVADS